MTPKGATARLEELRVQSGAVNLALLNERTKTVDHIGRVKGSAELQTSVEALAGQLSFAIRAEVA